MKKSSLHASYINAAIFRRTFVRPRTEKSHVPIATIETEQQSFAATLISVARIEAI
jgi:hypothetical protein